ncbi:MAG: hypothetical protein WC047_00090 [Kiritimatiellales bacterium]
MDKTNRVIPITAHGIEVMDANYVATILWEQEQEIERLTAEVKRLDGKAEKPGNRVLTPSEVRASAKGCERFIEWRFKPEFNGFYVYDLVFQGQGAARGLICDFACVDRGVARVWSNRKPTAEESAAVPWKECADA